MFRRIKGPFFLPYRQKREVELLKRDAEGMHADLGRLLDLVKQEQQQRLQTLRRSGPWDTHWDTTARQFKEQAASTLLRLQRYRQMRHRLQQLEARLPPARGLNLLRYLNPWIFPWVLSGLVIALQIAVLVDHLLN